MDKLNAKTVTKKDILESLVEKVGEENAQKATDVFSSLIDTLVSALEGKRSVMLKTVGTFAVSEKAARNGVRNPKTGEEMVLPARTVVTLKGTHKDSNKLKTSDLINMVHDQHPEVSAKFVQTCLFHFIDMINHVRTGESRIELRGFGVFFPTLVKAKELRNPQNNEPVWVDEKIKLRFRLSTKIEESLNVA